MCELPETAELYLDSARGQYIPQNFFEVTKPECINWHCDTDTKDWILDQCSSPEKEFYNDAWNDAECYGMVTLTNPDTEIEYTLYQDGDLWIIPVDAEWPENEDLGSMLIADKEERNEAYAIEGNES
jgi:hypothetical protein